MLSAKPSVSLDSVRSGGRGGGGSHHDGDGGMAGATMRTAAGSVSGGAGGAKIPTPEEYVMSGPLDKPLESQKSPGPIYLPKLGAIGDMPVSTFKNSSKMIFSTAPRYPSGSKGDMTPGPGAYQIDGRELKPVHIRGREKFGTQVLSSAAEVPGPGEYPRLETAQTTKHNPPAASLKSRPLEKPAGFSSPAPNQYQKMQPINKIEYVTNLKNAPGVKMGKPPKPKNTLRESIFASPGPGEYGTNEGIKQLSTLPASPAFSITPRRETKFGAARVTPAFHKPMEGIGKQPLSEKKTAPSPSFSGRVSFGSVYGGK